MSVNWNKIQLPSGNWGITANDEVVLDEWGAPIVFSAAEDADAVADDMNAA